ncbi:Heat shock protein beta-11 [Sorochytrium milnesiophthora]
MSVAVAFATSEDPRHPAAGVVQSSASFWTTTGGFPQQLVLSLSGSTDPTAVVNKVVITSSGVKRIEVSHSSDGKSSAEYAVDEVIDVPQSDADDNADALSTHTVRFSTPTAMTFLKLSILSGWSDFITVQRVAIE